MKLWVNVPAVIFIGTVDFSSMILRILLLRLNDPFTHLGEERQCGAKFLVYKHNGTLQATFSLRLPKKLMTMTRNIKKKKKTTWGREGHALTYVHSHPLAKWYQTVLTIIVGFEQPTFRCDIQSAKLCTTAPPKESGIKSNNCINCL